MPSKNKKKNLRKILGALKPSEKVGLDLAELKEDTKEGIAALVRGFAKKLSDLETKFTNLSNKLNDKIDNLPEAPKDLTKDIKELKKEFGEEFSKFRGELDNLPEGYDDTELKKYIKEKIKNRGGGSAPFWNYVGTYIAVTETYPIRPDDYVINATSGTFTTTLPTATRIRGREYNIKNSGLGVITVATTSSETVDGSATLTVDPDCSFTVMSDGVNWIIV